MLIVGLTGGIATGKTTVARMLADRGAVVVDADELAHTVEEPGQPAYRQIVARFGSGVVLPGGHLDRTALGRIVFSDPGALADLERITHPPVRALITEQIAAASASDAPLVAVDIPLLFERGAERFAGVLLVYAPQAVQLHRLIARSGLDEADARRRIAAQMPIEEKRAQATWTIDNGGSLEATAAQVSRWWRDVVT